MDTQNDIYSQAFDHMPFMCDPSNRASSNGVLRNNNESDFVLSGPSDKQQIRSNRRTAVRRGAVPESSRAIETPGLFNLMGQNQSIEQFVVTPPPAARTDGIRGEITNQEDNLKKRTGYDYTRNMSAHQVVVRDDYSQPPDKLSSCPEGPLQTTSDYTEPYHSQDRKSAGFLHRRSHGLKGRQINSITKSEESEIYELARDIDEIDGTVLVSHKLPEQYSVIQDSTGQEYNHLVELNDQISKKASLQKADTSYDHLHVWQDKLSSKSSLNASTVEEKRQSVVSDDVFIPDMAQNNPNPMPANYEEPWDSKERQQILDKMLEKASRRSTNTPECSITSSNEPSCLPGLSRPPDTHTQTIRQARVIEMDSPLAGIYEDAWDTPENQRRLSEIIEKAEARFSQSGEASPKLSAISEQFFSQSSDNNPQTPPVPLHARTPQKAKHPSDGTYDSSWNTRQSQSKSEEKIYRMERESRTGVVDKTERTSPNLVANRKVFAPQISPSHRHCQQHQHVLSERIDPMIPLEKQKFYHGPIKRDKAEKMLLVHREGSYLVRLSETSRNAYSLSIKGHQGISMHIKITCRPDGSYILGENSPPFNTIPEMVDYYTTNALPIKEAEKICLIHPIST